MISFHALLPALAGADWLRCTAIIWRKALQKTGIEFLLFFLPDKATLLIWQAATSLTGSRIQMEIGNSFHSTNHQNVLCSSVITGANSEVVLHHRDDLPVVRSRLTTCWVDSETFVLTLAPECWASDILFQIYQTFNHAYEQNSKKDNKNTTKTSNIQTRTSKQNCFEWFLFGKHNWGRPAPVTSACRTPREMIFMTGTWITNTLQTLGLSFFHMIHRYLQYFTVIILQ